MFTFYMLWNSVNSRKLVHTVSGSGRTISEEKCCTELSWQQQADRMSSNVSQWSREPCCQTRCGSRGHLTTDFYFPSVSSDFQALKRQSTANLKFWNLIVLKNWPEYELTALTALCINSNFLEQMAWVCYSVEYPLSYISSFWSDSIKIVSCI